MATTWQYIWRVGAIARVVSKPHYGRYNDLIYPHILFWATCCLICFITIVKLFLTLILTMVLFWKNASWRVWSIYRGCLLLHGTWSHIWYIQRSVYAHCLICISFRTYEIEYCSLFLSFHWSVLEYLNSSWIAEPCMKCVVLELILSGELPFERASSPTRNKAW
jgi:hypothetical protein